MEIGSQTVSTASHGDTFGESTAYAVQDLVAFLDGLVAHALPPNAAESISIPKTLDHGKKENPIANRSV